MLSSAFLTLLLLYLLAYMGTQPGIQTGDGVRACVYVGKGNMGYFLCSPAWLSVMSKRSCIDSANSRLGTSRPGS